MKLLALTSLFFSVFYISAQHQIGHYKVDFVDPDRGNRVIETEIYYPSTTAGDNTPAASGSFPVIVFGHGFVMAWDAYENLWEEFVPRGYIMVFPRTEGSILSADHQEFGWDLQYLVTEMQTEGANAASPINGAVASNTALMGHSMGGGASFLAADSLCQNGNTNLKTLVGLAPAESSSNGVSSINSALSVTVPSLVLSGQQDGVTPAADHHIPMYDSLASDCKTFVNIIGGAHCYFANSNFSCDFGEGTASSGISISRTDQHEVTFDFLNLWLDYSLKQECEQFSVFQDSLNNSARITFNQSCNIQPLSLTVATSDASCNGVADGSASPSGNGGSPSYTYDWGGINPNALPAGSHSVILTDADGCSVSETFSINEPTAINVSVSTSDENCGQSDGTASLTISGGIPTYSENWGSLNPNSLPAGTHAVVISDANGCSQSEMVTINSIGGPTVSSTVLNATCNGATGSANLSITGGTPSYSEDWMGEDPMDLEAGTYTYNVTDANGCVTSGSVIINEPSEISISSSITDEACGQSDGTASLVVTGGTPTYSENWGALDPNALPSGTHSVTVIDANGCSQTETIVINSIGGPSVTSSVTNVTCNGENDGTAVLNISGGTASYTEDWMGENPNALPAGNYNYSVMDANGCSSGGSVTVTEPSLLSATSNITDETLGNDGEISVVVSGGTPGYTYSLDGINYSSNSSFSGLSSGTYTVYIQDLNGCELTLTATIDPSSGVNVEDVVFKGARLFPNPVANLLTVKLDQLVKNGEILVQDVTGKVLFRSQINSKILVVDFSSYSKGVYFVSLNNGNEFRDFKVVK